MEIKACSFFSLFFISLLLLSLPCFSKGGGLDSGIYEIDYRGPETHSRIPPPNWSRQKYPDHPERSSSTHRKFKGSRAGNEQSGMEIHG